MLTDWYRVAAPQHDGYDVEALLDLAQERWCYEPKYEGGPRWMGVELLATTSKGSDIEPAPLDHPNLEKVTRVLKDVWHGEQTMFMLDFFSPLSTGREGRGCVSGHDKPSIGGRMGVYVTVDDPTGCAEGIVHEIAHQRLHCAGLDLDTHDGVLLRNDNELRFFSPIRRDVLRPMCALVHGVYAYAFVLEVDLAASDGTPYLQQNLPKVRRGLEEIRRGARPTQSGERFLRGFYEWADDLVAQGESRLKSLFLPEIKWEGPQ